MPEAVRLLVARRDGQPVAAAFFLCDREALYGRYWGCVEDHPFLHFELCYHRAIDWAIAHGLAQVEAGAQGEHKLARGFLPAFVRSRHRIADPRFAEALLPWCAEEAEAVRRYARTLAERSPFRHAG